jgi:DNA-binding transcriptional ArsR family regulator
VATYVDALDALGDPTRREIYERLARAPMAVGELASELPVSRPAVSQHLRVLKQAGLVRAQEDGARRIHHLDPDGLRALREHFDGFWDLALASFKAEAERNERSKR